MPDAPARIWHFPETQTPLAQSGPVEHVVFGNIPVGSQSFPVHLPLWQSLAAVHGEPAGDAPPELEPPMEVDPPELEPEPETPEPEPPPRLEPPSDGEPLSDVDPPDPPSIGP